MQAATWAASALVLAALTAGVPAALYAVGGSPVPRYIPSWHQVIAALASPDDGTLFLAAVRWVSWLAWAAFTISVLTEVLSHARGRPAARLPGIARTQALAAALVGIVILRLLPAAHLPPHPRQPGQASAVASPGQGRPLPAVAVTAARADQAGTAAAQAGSARPRPVPRQRAYTVAEGDNLWAIAARHLGDGGRWPEIYQLNRGWPQPAGGSLTDPDLIYPGWILLLPPGHTAPAGPAPRVSPGHSRARHSPASRPGVPGSPPSQHPRHPGHQGEAPPRRLTASWPGYRDDPVGIGLPGGGLAGITLAAAVSAALVAWRLHRRRTARPRWPIPASRPEPPLPDVITRLRRAHLRNIDIDGRQAPGQAWPAGGMPASGAPARPAAGQHPWPPGNPRAWLPAPPRALQLPAGTVAFGIRNGAEVPFPALAAQGLGLTGPGAPGAARALMAGLLAAGSQGSGQAEIRVLIPQADAARLTAGQQLPGITAGPPDGLLVTPGLVSALDHAETEITRRMRARKDAEDDPAAPDDRDAGTQLPLVLITSADRRSAARIQAVLEAGAGAGAAGIILGDWPAGATCHVSTDGTVSSADPRLAGIQAFHLTAPDLSSVLSLLRGAQGYVTRDEPRPAAPRLRQEPAASQHRTQAPPPQEPDGSTGWGQAEARPRIAAEPQGRYPARPALVETGPPARSPAGNDGTAPSAPLSPGTLPAAAPPGSAKAVEITMLGPLRIAAGGAEVRGGLRKARELLAYLALHPGGVSGEAISEALWPDSDPRYAARQRHLALRKARDILRTATGLPRPMFIILASERYRLDPALVGVDLWRFDAALARARSAASDGAQLAALRQAAALYQGPLADGSAYDWAERYAEHARRRALDALARIAELLQPADPELALQALETAIAHDPYNEAVYQKIMHLQAGLGRPDAVTRTLRLLQARLAELDLSPDPATLQAANVTAGYLASYPQASPPPADRSPAGQPPRPRRP